MGCCWGELQLAARAWPGGRPDSAWRTRAPGRVREGLYLAVASRPPDKYLTFQAYLEEGGARRALFLLPPGLTGSVCPGVGSAGWQLGGGLT